MYEYRRAVSFVAWGDGAFDTVVVAAALGARLQACRNCFCNGTHCNTLQHTARHCNTLQHTLQHSASSCVEICEPQPFLQRLCTAARCNTLLHTATHCNTLQHTATHCNTLQHTATHCNTLQYTATHCYTLQHFASIMHRNTWPATVLATVNPATHCNKRVLHMFLWRVFFKEDSWNLCIYAFIYTHISMCKYVHIYEWGYIVAFVYNIHV